VPADAEIATHVVTERLCAIAESGHDLPKVSLRRSLAAFVAQPVVDLETRDAELEIRLPDWILQGQDLLCLDDGSPWKSGNEAHHDPAVIILAPLLLWMLDRYSYGAVDYAGAASHVHATTR